VCDIGDDEAIDPICWPKRYRDAREGKPVDPVALLDEGFRIRAQGALESVVHSIGAAALLLRTSYKHGQSLDPSASQSPENSSRGAVAAAKSPKGMHLRSGRVLATGASRGAASEPQSDNAAPEGADGDESSNDEELQEGGDEVMTGTDQSSAATLHQLLQGLQAGEHAEVEHLL